MGEKKFHATVAKNVRELVDLMNDYQLKKEEIISVLDRTDGVFVIFEK